MGLLRIAEVFGFPVEDHTKEASEGRAQKLCPFRGNQCTKDSRTDPLGICSLSDGSSLAVVCPTRFVVGGRIFTDVGRLAFGSNVPIVAVPEIPVLRAKQRSAGAKPRKIGKVDYLIGRLDKTGKPVDFAALEVQAVYISGRTMRPAMHHFLSSGQLPEGSERRPDWRSSAQKRLMPQLALKIPLFRRWGKKVFVAVDSRFFSELPEIKTTDSLPNSEVTWLSYPFGWDGTRYDLGDPDVVYTTWDDVLTALREGVAPDPEEIFEEIERKKRERNLPTLIT